MNRNQTVPETFVVTEPEQAAALLHPVRSEIISLLKEPRSATELSKVMNDSAQKVNYHLKTLEKVGLVMRAGTRNVRNLVEVLYRSAGKTFLLSDSLGLSQETVRKLKDQTALAHVLSLTEKIKRDTVSLMEEAENEEIPSAVLEMELSLKGVEERQAFLQDYANMLSELIKKHHDPEQGKSRTYHVSMAMYPKPEGGGTA
ncbi:helix-turn-helix domain-containing protein [Fictibacillus phosphorivorans]|uniref:helix-turn-helix domain-containing protein n=1 Tax=Fictibacillus phosphorivorans TaxID=1221500 RepID=UPI00203E4BB4|nr:helix-turn-helix domain-containing protein [Fictibacillus phosphorivorans]MCM3776901.1 helix-turn-helix domain-containing protein [Fictibacillus phosphorivorans]